MKCRDPSKQWDPGPKVEVKEFKNPVAGMRGSGSQWQAPQVLDITMSGPAGRGFLVFGIQRLSWETRGLQHGDLGPSAVRGRWLWCLRELGSGCSDMGDMYACGWGVRIH